MARQKGSCRTILLAKAPLPGQVKTRLIPALGPEGAAALAAAMLERTAAIALEAALGPVELCVAPSRDLPVWQELRLPRDLQWSDQGEGDLGERMARAARRGLEAGSPVLLIGTDCPGLGANQLRAAAEALQEHDGVLVPTWDGGYALVGMGRFDPSLFDAMPWSTPAVLAQTRLRLAAAGWSWKELPALVDIDTPADLAALVGDLKELAVLWGRRDAG
ncbi:TIGR04282 family arsenosugar biosynthesis glycosyltransferase [Synechococcus sp. Tobar12-5m-g]|uniref:TIGR04282 family arsenosugar biosynthesis glycosyltransferase n=1 Tax=unclassified Synechococcus TaxID=2626047 RepID=UPI0020CE4D2A|nr:MULTISPECIES: TIGR04282 family arsenosugar biosynthesis glycosyltransferase [unclassified Synechococcus]MCP9771703.1 TIGR04282 family arsenosugar biosynthesis glycosyltransferase [Synechococcus sp. Tobar12-5m-g]MCP9872644.1 TIGR04282 family arsenosugar biosynthesis glycosyltransferase [Synechococcus sp. Cruz CV-v-12]